LTTFTRSTAGDVTFLEGPPGCPLIRDTDDVTMLLEECFAVPTRAALLYSDNLPPSFFDVSSQQAGTFLQKLRNYGLRVAVVAPADSVSLSRRFGELAAAERRDGAFAMFDSRADALTWLVERHDPIR
jgi:hypothetical protein